MALTYHQTKLVKGTIPALKEHGEQITTIFYRNMLREHPELNNYFNIVNQANGRQPRALTGIILNYANNINHITDLIPKLERMCQKHFSLGITPDQYEIVGKYLIAAFAEVLGSAMTPEIREAWDKAYWMLAKMLIGREAQLYRDHGSWKGWRRFRIQQRMEESDDIYSLYLVPEDGQPLPSFMPGQYVSVRVPVPEMGFMQARQYSLSERPRSDYYRITVKRDRGSGSNSNSSGIGSPGRRTGVGWSGGGGGGMGMGMGMGMGGMRKGRRVTNTPSSKFAFSPGIVSNMLIDQKNVGDVVELTHPAGDFFLDINNGSSSPIVLLSAGVGVTPMISILNTVAERQPERPVSWIQGGRNSVPFLLHVRRTARERPSVHVSIFKSELADFDLGGVTYDHDYRIDLAKIHPEDLWLRHSTAEYFICGPEVFMVEMARNLRDRGVDGSRIHVELFSTGDAEFQVDMLRMASQPGPQDER